MAVTPAASAGPRIRLYAKPSRSSRILLITIAVLTCLWILGAGAAFSSTAVYFGGWLAGIVLIAAVGFPMGLRSGAWLEGSTLAVRSSLARAQAAGQLAWLADNWPGTPSSQLR